MLDMHGSVVLTGRMEASATQEIALPELAPGLYLLRLTGADGRQAGQAVVVR